VSEPGMIIFLLGIGVFFWWLLYGVECFINGTGRIGVFMPFACWFEELLWNLPFVGKRFRLKFTDGDKEWASKLPGPIHFVLMCIVFPLIPVAVYLLIVNLMT